MRAGTRLHDESKKYFQRYEYPAEGSKVRQQRVGALAASVQKIVHLARRRSHRKLTVFLKAYVLFDHFQSKSFASVRRARKFP